MCSLLKLLLSALRVGDSLDHCVRVFALLSSRYLSCRSCQATVAISLSIRRGGHDGNGLSENIIVSFIYRPTTSVSGSLSQILAGLVMMEWDGWEPATGLEECAVFARAILDNRTVKPGRRYTVVSTVLRDEVCGEAAGVGARIDSKVWICFRLADGNIGNDICMLGFLDIVQPPSTVHLPVVPSLCL